MSEEVYWLLFMVLCWEGCFYVLLLFNDLNWYLIYGEYYGGWKCVFKVVGVLYVGMYGICYCLIIDIVNLGVFIKVGMVLMGYKIVVMFMYYVYIEDKLVCDVVELVVSWWLVIIGVMCFVEVMV